MRDDIHKRAPGGRAWQRLVRVCQRDADWQDRGPSAALAALRAEVAEGAGPAIFQTLHPDHSQRELFIEKERAAQMLSEASLARQPLSSFQRSALDALARDLARGGDVDSAAMERAVNSALRSRQVAWERELDAQLALDHPRDRREMVRRVHAVLAVAPVQELVSKAALGQLLELPRRVRPQLNIDKAIG